MMRKMNPDSYCFQDGIPFSLLHARYFGRRFFIVLELNQINEGTISLTFYFNQTNGFWFFFGFFPFI
jgi:hypothetical protein